MLEVSGVNSFYGKAQVLNDLNFTVDRGTVVALLGRNGAGKTTTMKSIMQLVRPRQGKIIYQGQDITGWPSHKVARNGLGYVPEERRIFTQLTVMENLEVGRQPPRDGCTTDGSDESRRTLLKLKKDPPRSPLTRTDSRGRNVESSKTSALHSASAGVKPYTLKKSRSPLWP